MSNEIHLPDIGADQAEVTEILVKVGDVIDVEAPLIAVEGDKAAMEVPSPQAGTIEEIKVSIGDEISTGTLIVILTPAESEKQKTEDEDQSSKNSKSDSLTEDKEVRLPDIGAEEAEVTQIIVGVGDSVMVDDPLIAVEGDKAAMEVPSPFEGVVQEVKVTPGQMVSTGTSIMIFEVAVAATEKKPATPPATSEPKPKQVASPSPTKSTTRSSETFVENREYAHASPVVRRLAREFGVNLAKVNGTGRKNRILKEDVQEYVKEALRRLDSGASGFDLLPWPEVDFAKFGEIEKKPLSRIQKLTGANLHRNWVRIPHVTQWDEVDVTELEKSRKKRNAEEVKRESGIKYTILVFVMQAVAKALQDLPSMNSSLALDGKSLILKKYVDLGIAVDTPNGLVVPVVRGVEKKSAEELTQDLFSLSAKAREGKLTKEEMMGSSFTISSLGGLGGTAFTPIVNAPNVGILGLSRSEQKPVWNGKSFDPRLMLPLSLSYDHRVIDGADGVRFLNFLKEALSELTNETA